MSGRPDLLQKLRRVPEKPGAYLMRDEAGGIIYVGKAKRLRDRLGSYFGRGRTDAKGAALRERIADFEYVVTDSEVEALILELHLIKEHRPRYNVNLRDDKKFPYLKVTAGEPYPRVFATRRVEKDGAQYFGPYTDAKAMRRTLRMLRQVFPVRTCRHDLVRNRPARPCLNFEIRRCLGPCTGHVRPEEYALMIRNLCAFLSGNRESLLRDLTAEMARASTALDFETAARLRDQIDAVRKVTERQKMFSPDAGDRDVVVASALEKRALGLVLKVRDGKLLGRESYPLAVAPETPPSEILTTFLKLRYGSASDIPPEILVEDRPEEVAALESWLGGRRGSKVEIAAPRRGPKAGLVRLARKNADLLLVEDLASSRRGLDPGVEDLGASLGLDRPPVRIEGFDVSSLGGSETVASLVLFENGRPLKSGYRNFRIRSAHPGDDFAAMEEVVQRRYRRLVEERGDLPGLVLVDGGKGQVSAAARALGRLGLDLPVAGLAKREETVFLARRRDPVAMGKDSAGKRLLERIRDEAHRVAVSHQRVRRGRAVRESDLDAIPGIGPARRRRLLAHFGSLRALAQARPEDIRHVPGMGTKTADRIYAHFHGERAS